MSRENCGRPGPGRPDSADGCQQGGRELSGAWALVIQSDGQPRKRPGVGWRTRRRRARRPGQLGLTSDGLDSMTPPKVALPDVRTRMKMTGEATGGAQDSPDQACSGCGQFPAAGEHRWEVRGVGLGAPDQLLCLGCLMDAFHDDAARELGRRIAAAQVSPRRTRPGTSRVSRI